jgi:propanol-preferring alcohol dehydrogenase
VKNWKVGDRGGVKPMWDVCMNCEFCWDGLHETYCAGAVATGLMTAGLFSQSPRRFRKVRADGNRNVPTLHNQPSKVHNSNPGQR